MTCRSTMVLAWRNSPSIGPRPTSGGASRRLLTVLPLKSFGTVFSSPISPQCGAFWGPTGRLAVGSNTMLRSQVRSPGTDPVPRRIWTDCRAQAVRIRSGYETCARGRVSFACFCPNHRFSEPALTPSFGNLALLSNCRNGQDRWMTFGASPWPSKTSCFNGPGARDARTRPLSMSVSQTICSGTTRSESIRGGQSMEVRLSASSISRPAEPVRGTGLVQRRMLPLCPDSAPNLRPSSWPQASHSTWSPTSREPAPIRAAS